MRARVVCSTPTMLFTPWEFFEDRTAAAVSSDDLHRELLRRGDSPGRALHPRATTIGAELAAPASPERNLAATRIHDPEFSPASGGFPGAPDTPLPHVAAIPVEPPTAQGDLATPRMLHEELLPAADELSVALDAGHCTTAGEG